MPIINSNNIIVDALASNSLKTTNKTLVDAINEIGGNIDAILNIFNIVYYQISNVSDGDTITDTDFINAVTNNYPVKINNVMCYYCRTQGNLIEYLTAGLNNNNVHLNLVVFDTTTNIITFNQVDIVNN